jgi:hypothetical protein
LLQNGFVQIHNDARGKNHFASGKCKKYTEKVFSAFCVDFFSFAQKKLHKKFSMQNGTGEYGTQNDRNLSNEKLKPFKTTGKMDKMRLFIRKKLRSK